MKETKIPNHNIISGSTTKQVVDLGPITLLINLASWMTWDFKTQRHLIPIVERGHVQMPERYKGSSSIVQYCMDRSSGIANTDTPKPLWR